jgi:hypothetical protein
MRELENRENQNILNLKINKIISDLPEISQKKIILLKALNFSSPRFSSFFNPALLNSPNKSVKMLQSNSWASPLIFKYFPRMHILPTWLITIVYYGVCVRRISTRRHIRVLKFWDLVRVLTSQIYRDMRVLITRYRK